MTIRQRIAAAWRRLVSMLKRNGGGGEE